jgi:hypothetical protein
VIACRVQGHPTRGDLHARLLPHLEAFQPELLLHSSMPPDPWAGYKRCLMDIPDGAGHLLVVQDDAMPQPGFAEAVPRIAARWPDAPVCLFLGAFPASTAAQARRAKPDVRYVPLGPTSFMPLVCVLWPAQAARSFLSWSDRAHGITKADDGNAARWAKATRTQVMVAVPSLVQHDDDAPSVKGGRISVPWTESWRYAQTLADDCSTYGW